MIHEAENFTTTRRVWIEKTIVRNRPDRLTGPHSLGQAIWSPQQSTDGRDIYANLREVRRGDLVLHFVNNEALAGISEVAAEVDDAFTGLEFTSWAGQPGYRVQLEGYRELDPPLDRAWLFNDPTVAEEAKTIAREPRGRGIFYNDRLELNQGAYLTEASTHLADFLARVYQHHTGEHLFFPTNAMPATEAGNSSTTPASRAWIYSPGNQAVFWDGLYESGKMALGWNDIGDFKSYNTGEQMKAALEAEYGGEKDQGQNAKMCFDFANAMAPGDIIYAKRGRQAIIGRGIVTGPYEYDPKQPDLHHVRSVQWTARLEKPWPDLLPMKTLTEATDRREQFERLFSSSQLIADDSKPTVLAPEEQQRYTLDEALKGLFMPRGEFEQLIWTWRKKQNLILQGPPGVGKSFIARRLAYALMGFKDSTRVRTVQFHQNYAYEDFVQGFRPTGSGFALRDGVFLNFCKRALEDKTDQKYVFIIDEINRGNLSKILGELMLLIEADKRKSEWAVKLAYAESADERFYVPANIYLLGMMNTADRSLAVVDYALRRRFAFVTLQPCFEQAAFKATLMARGVNVALADQIVSRMIALNGDIANDTANLGPGYCVGHSFFVPAKAQTQVQLDATWYSNIIRAEILPLLDEYWFDQPERVARWRRELLA